MTSPFGVAPVGSASSHPDQNPPAGARRIPYRKRPAVCTDCGRTIRGVANHVKHRGACRANRPALIARLFARSVRRSNGCIEWTGARDDEGYGKITLDGRAERVHRVSWIAHRGELPRGVPVTHRCDNPPCFNPRHLRRGTQLANMREKVRKGRARNNRRHGSTALTPVLAAQIRADYAAGRGTHRQLARRHNVTRPTIAQVLRSRTWKTA